MTDKEMLISMVIEESVGLMPPEQVEALRGRLYLRLSEYSIKKEETALSTEFECDNDAYIKKFLAIKAIAGRTERTLDHYKRDLIAFFDRIQKPLKSITTDDIRLYLAKRDQIDKVSKVTQDNELRTLRSFYKTLIAEEVLFKDPTARIEKIKTPKKLKEPLSELEIEKIRAACKDEKELCVVEMLLSTGCRASELAMANKEDIRDDKLKIMGKGRKERIVYLNAKAQLALEKYLSTRKDNMPGILISYWDKSTASLWNKTHLEKVREGTPTGEHINKAAINTMVRKIGKRAGVKGVHAHRFRRTAATLALRRGMPIEQVSRMLGHANLTTTQIYARSSEEDIHNAHIKYLS